MHLEMSVVQSFSDDIVLDILRWNNLLNLCSVVWSSACYVRPGSQPRPGRWSQEQRSVTIGPHSGITSLAVQVDSYGGVIDA